MFPRSTIIIKKKEVGLLPTNIHHLKMKYSGDCPICLQYQVNPVSSYCEHVFCKNCIYESLNFSLDCPVCKQEISLLFDVQLSLKDDLKVLICLKLLSDFEMTLKPVSDYENDPYQKIYYLTENTSTNIKKKTYTSSLHKVPNFNYYFYQSVDGQPYFLDNEILSRIIKREGIKNLPRLLYGKIESVKESVVGKKKSLRHLQEDTTIYIVRIKMK